MGTKGTRARWLMLAASILLLAVPARGTYVSFERGDVFLSLESGPVQWWFADGAAMRLLVPTVPGTGEGMAFDASGNLYVTRWCVDPSCSTGNTVEMYDVLGRSWGAVGSGYNCNPHAILFDATDTAWVGQAGCTGDILKFPPGGDRNPTAFDVAPDLQGSFWIDLAADGCTMFYTSFGANVKRFDVCANAQLPDFNAAPLPGGAVQDVRVLPDGGVIVSAGEAIVRLASDGTVAQTYTLPGEPSFWAGLDLATDGAFWAANYESSKAHKFDLASGAVLATLNAGTPPHSVVAVRVMK